MKGNSSARDILRSAMNSVQQMASNSDHLPMRPGQHGMVAFGIGKDEHGRNIAKFGKVVKNDAGETTEEKFVERCLDPERDELTDLQSPPNFAEDDCIEVEAIEVTPEDSKTSLGKS